MKQVAVIGGARLAEAQTAQVEALGRLIRMAGFSLVCGGLGGVMAAVCRGFQAVAGDGVAVGILPGNDPSAANRWVDIIVPTGLDVARNALVVSAGAGVIAYGGGAGTLSELALASQLGRPMLLLHGGGGWVDRLCDDEFLDQRGSVPLAHADSLEEVVQWLAQLESIPTSFGAINSDHLTP